MVSAFRLGVLLLALLIAGCTFPMNIETPATATPISAVPATPIIVNTAIPTPTIPTASAVPSQGNANNVPTSTTLRVKIFLVAPNSATGTPVGCGDSLVAVERDIPRTASPLSDTLALLFALKTQYYGQSGLYNALYQSDLHINRISAHNGVFNVDLGGTVTLGGECDSPRFEAQITRTILQFSTVQRADVTINGKPLKDILSSK